MYSFQFLIFAKYPPPCLQAQLECTDVEKRPSGENVILFKGMPLLQYSRAAAYTRKQSQTLFRLLFLMSKNQAHELQNGSLGDPKIIKKLEKWSPAWNAEKIRKKHRKIEALEPWKAWFCSDGLHPLPGFTWITRISCADSVAWKNIPAWKQHDFYH